MNKIVARSDGLIVQGKSIKELHDADKWNRKKTSTEFNLIIFNSNR